MQTRYWPLMAGLALCLTAALACVAYMFSGGESPLLAFAFCALALMAGQVLLGVYGALQSSLAENNDRQMFKKLANVGAGQDMLQKQTDFALSEISGFKAQDQARSAAMAQSLGELKTSYQALAQSLVGQAAKAQDQQVDFAPVPPRQARPEQAETGIGQLTVALEPIVDLVSGRTAHYRLHLGPEQLIEQASHNARRPELDFFAVNEALHLLQRLHQRDRQVKLFMPISGETLSSPPDMLRLLETLRSRAEQAGSLVFEMPHVMLARLPGAALEGLGSLARCGQPLALAGIAMAGLDPLALQGLNVRYVSIDVAAIDPRPEATADALHFAQKARTANVQVMLANVSDASSLAGLRQLARLGSGPAFAAPRRVRRDAGPLHVGLAA
jgi:EAL domain-containing protein (putative c-di-GMP-specific phosphodiesterase class I)